MPSENSDTSATRAERWISAIICGVFSLVLTAPVAYFVLIPITTGDLTPMELREQMSRPIFFLIELPGWFLSQLGEAYVSPDETGSWAAAFVVNWLVTLGFFSMFMLASWVVYDLKRDRQEPTRWEYER